MIAVDNNISWGLPFSPIGCAPFYPKPSNGAINPPLLMVQGRTRYHADWGAACWSLIILLGDLREIYVKCRFDFLSSVSPGHGWSRVFWSKPPGKKLPYPQTKVRKVYSQTPAFIALVNVASSKGIDVNMENITSLGECQFCHSSQLGDFFFHQISDTHIDTGGVYWNLVFIIKNICFYLSYSLLP